MCGVGRCSWWADQAGNQPLPQPQALDALGVTPDQVAAALRSENQDVPVGTLLSQQEKVIQIAARMQRPEGLWPHHRGAQNRVWSSQRGLHPGPGGHRGGRRAGKGGKPGLVQRPAHLAATGTKIAGREHDCRGRRPFRAMDIADMQSQPCLPGCGWNPSLMVHARSAWLCRTCAAPARRCVTYGADRVPVSQLVAIHRHNGADAAHCAHRTFLVMYALGFTINMITLMACRSAWA